MGGTGGPGGRGDGLLLRPGPCPEPHGRFDWKTARLVWAPGTGRGDE